MDLEKIKKLIEFVGSSQVSGMTVSENGVSVRITHGANVSKPPRTDPMLETSWHHPAPRPQPAQSAADTAAHAAIITAPSFGVFHRAPGPDALPFVEVEDEIAEGQELCIIGAMKVFTTIRAGRNGKVARILTRDGEDVDLGQPLLEIAC